MDKPIQVFCCYAREDQSFLLQLKNQLSLLERNRLIVVQADINISPGEDWEQKISHYLNTAQIILLLVSDHFMASNYCYSKEMERALERGKKGEARVVPIILRPVHWQEAPFARLQCLPRDAKPVTTWSNRDEALSNIAQGIQLVCEELLGASPPPSLRKIGIDKVRDGKVVRAENIILPDRLRHIQTSLGDLQPAFDNLIAELTQNFVGRRLVFKELDKFLIDETSGYFIFEGDPGIGKSALIAQLVKERGYLHHFNTRSQGITRPDLFLESICVQLISLFQLDYVPTPKKDYENGFLLNRLLKDASGKLQADEQLVLAVDALDEADWSNPDQNLLYLPPGLPKGVFIVATNRHRHFIPLHVSHQGRLILKHDSQENKEDVREYIRFYIDKHRMQQQVRSFNLQPENFIETMLTKSEGNFMYLHYVLPAVRDGSFLLGTLEELPQGLKAYYQFHWKKMRNQASEMFDKLYKPVICVLVAMEEDVSIDEIAEVTGLEFSQVLQVVRKWREFLHEKKTNGIPFYRIYHSTFQEFLEDEVDPGLRTYHRMIVSAYSGLKNKYAEEDG